MSDLGLNNIHLNPQATDPLDTRFQVFSIGRECDMVLTPATRPIAPFLEGACVPFPAGAGAGAGVWVPFKEVAGR